MSGVGRWLVGLMVGGCGLLVVLVWTLAVHGLGAARKRRLDPLVFALLVLAALRQADLVSRAALSLFRPHHGLVHYCGLLVWAGSSVAVLQAAVVATLALCLAGRFTPRYWRLVTRSHLSYHLVSAALLSSCVGVAAVLSRGPDCLRPSAPDPRFALFTLGLHGLLTLVAVLGLLAAAVPRPLPKHPSASDLSSLSSRRTLSDASRYLFVQGKVDSMSTTSSTHSRAFLAPVPPHAVPHLPTVAGVSLVLVTLLTNHLPLLAVWGGLEVGGLNWPLLYQLVEWSVLAEGILLPLVLILTDREFLQRVARVYTRPKPPDFSRPPQGAYGKFVPRGSMMQQEASPRENPPQVRFPITNGSLFASLDPDRLHSHHRTIKGRGVGGGRWYWGTGEDPMYASLSGKSACSATTQANSDFEYFPSRSTKQPRRPNQQGEAPGKGLAHKRSVREEEVSRQVRRHSSREVAREAAVREAAVREAAVREAAVREAAVREAAVREAARDARPLARRLSRQDLLDLPSHLRSLVPVMSMDSLMVAPKTDYRQRNKWDSVPDLNKVFRPDYP